ALAASFFHVIFDKEPFQYGGVQAKERGLNWEGVDRGECTVLVAFLEKATDPDPKARFSSVAEALVALQEFWPKEMPPHSTRETGTESLPRRVEPEGAQLELREERVEW